MTLTGDWSDGYVDEGISSIGQSDDEISVSTDGGMQDVTHTSGTDVEKSIEQMNYEDILQLKFLCIEEAYVFYEQYGKIKGFGVRMDKIRRGKDGHIRRKQFVCSREGYRSEKEMIKTDYERQPRPITRCGCKALLRVHLNKESNIWVVTKFIDDHNHPMLHRNVVKFHRSHRFMTYSDIAQVNSMQSSGIKISNIMSYMEQQSGSYDNVTFIPKDLYNYFGREKRHKTSNGDVVAALEYLRAKQKEDSMLFIKHTVNSEGQLKNIFWADGFGRQDFNLFGDVIAFDSTYKKNIYNMPLVVFSGINHHQQSIVFAACLLSDERDETYHWVLQTLVEAMDGAIPISIVTDGDYAMRNAIRSVFPNANHRLCAWHLQRNAQTNVHDAYFTKSFGHVMMANIDETEFEERWASMLEDFGVKEHPWVQEVYAKKALWATAYLRGKFFGGMRTTSRSESINAYVGNYVDSKLNMFEFIKHFDRSLKSMRNKELQNEYYTEYGEPRLMSAFKSLEFSAAIVYTAKMHQVFMHQLNNVLNCVVEHYTPSVGCTEFIIRRDDRGGKRWQVLFDGRRGPVRCTCLMFESCGILCCHCLCVCVFTRIQSLPSWCILKRWTKNCKLSMSSGNLLVPHDGDSERVRYAALGHSCRWLSFLAAHSKDDFLHTRDHLMNLTRALEDKFVPIEVQDQSNAHHALHVKDPSRVRTKGRVRGDNNSQTKARRCGICHVQGHTRATCKFR